MMLYFSLLGTGIVAGAAILLPLSYFFAKLLTRQPPSLPLIQREQQPVQHSVPEIQRNAFMVNAIQPNGTALVVRNTAIKVATQSAPVYGANASFAEMTIYGPAAILGATPYAAPIPFVVARVAA